MLTHLVITKEAQVNIANYGLSNHQGNKKLLTSIVLCYQIKYIAKNKHVVEKHTFFLWISNIV